MALNWSANFQVRPNNDIRPVTAALRTRMVEKPWGRNVLPAPFAALANRRIGEVWFEPPPQLPQLLVKYIFTSEKLSVQVHPSDAQLPGHGKEECWLVIGAEPGAALGVGFRESLSRAAMRDAALDGSIEQLLEWYPVVPGDFFFIPAGTVHAIGAGVSLIEVQQTSDVTYRLYDYGRPRQLHLDEGINVAVGTPHDPALRRHLSPGESGILAAGPPFRLSRIAGLPVPESLRHFGSGAVLAIPVSGAIHVAGGAVAPGECALAQSVEAVDFSSDGVCLVAQPSR